MGKTSRGNLSIKILSVVFIFGMIFLAGNWFLREEQETRLNHKVFSVDFETILSDLENGNLDALVVYRGENEYPPKGSGAEEPDWTENDFLLIAKSLHQLSWGEDSGDWTILSAQYKKDCNENFGSFGSARYKFFKIIQREGKKSRLLSWITISPSQNVMEISNYEYSPVIVRWKGISLNQIKLSAGDVLEIAEKNGGNDMRAKNNNECSILINFRNAVWEVWYLDPDNDTLLKFLINPEGGDFKITN